MLAPMPVPGNGAGRRSGAFALTDRNVQPQRKGSPMRKVLKWFGLLIGVLVLAALGLLASLVLRPREQRTEQRSGLKVESVK